MCFGLHCCVVKTFLVVRGSAYKTVCYQTDFVLNKKQCWPLCYKPDFVPTRQTVGHCAINQICVLIAKSAIFNDLKNRKFSKKKRRRHPRNEEAPAEKIANFIVHSNRENICDFGLFAFVDGLCVFEATVADTRVLCWH